MAWIEFQINLDRTATALERIALVLERAFPEVPIEELAEPKKVEMNWIDPKAQYERDRKEMIEAGLDPDMLAYMPPQVRRRE